MPQLAALLRDEPMDPEEEECAPEESRAALESLVESVKEPVRQMAADVVASLVPLRRAMHTATSRPVAPHAHRVVARRPAGRSASRTRRVRTTARAAPGDDSSGSPEPVDVLRKVAA
jgi:hypothetical protein